MWKLVILMLCLLLTACGSYESGYIDGYQEKDNKQWILFGRNQYNEGFQAGRMEVFQDDWLAENLADMSIGKNQCPDITLKADPLMFLPSNWKRIGPDLYEIN